MPLIHSQEKVKDNIVINRGLTASLHEVKNSLLSDVEATSALQQCCLFACAQSSYQVVRQRIQQGDLHFFQKHQIPEQFEHR